jgi:hypothetical protein
MRILQYEPIHNAACTILCNLSRLGRAENVNEYNFQDTLLQYPELLACYLHEGQPFVRKETNNIDILFYFYGASQFDIVECKPPRTPIFGADGKATTTLREAIEQAVRYRAKIMAGRCKIIGQAASERKPRIIVIGCFPMSSSPAEDEAKAIMQELRASEWSGEYQDGALIVTTWRVLAENARTWFSSDSLRPDSSPSLNTIARAVLADLIHDVAEEQPKTASVRTTLEELVATHAGLKTSVALSQVTPKVVDLVRGRAQSLLEQLDEFELLQYAMQNRTLAFAALQLADIALYKEDRDIPWGHWEHGATYKIIDLLQDKRKVVDAIAPQLLRILSLDSSEDVIGMASHVARYLPKDEVAAWFNDQMFDARWAFTDPIHLLANPHQISFLQVGYCLALHGVPSAVSFMNNCAADVNVMANIACWNKAHAMRHMGALLTSLQTKVTSDQENLRAFRPWHTGVYEATRKMAE